jgi:hypothetical protein
LLQGWHWWRAGHAHPLLLQLLKVLVKVLQQVL